MAANYPLHALFEFGGTLHCVQGQDEIWACGIRGFFGSSGGPGSMDTWQDLDLPATMASMAVALQAWYQDANSAQSQDARLAWCKLNVINTAGHYADQTKTHVNDFPVPIAGAAASAVPSYLSLAYSWETANKRGLASRGRIYPTNYCFAADGAAVSGATAGANANAGKALINALKVTTGLNGGVFSPAVVSSKAAAWAYITGVRSGNVYDEQRRRRNAVRETYAHVDV